MHINQPDDAIDLVYCNAIDHAFNMDGFFEEQCRVIRPGGYALYEVIPGMKGEIFEAVEWASDAALFRKLLDYFEKVVRVETETHWMWFLLQNPRKDKAAGHATL